MVTKSFVAGVALLACAAGGAIGYSAAWMHVTAQTEVSCPATKPTSTAMPPVGEPATMPRGKVW